MSAIAPTIDSTNGFDAAVASGWQFYLDYLASGETQAKAALQAFPTLSEPVLRVAMARWLRDPRYGSRRRSALTEAQLAGATPLASSTIDLADDLADAEGVDPVRVAQTRISARQWLAARYDKTRFGNPTNGGVSVHVDVNNLHLQALRQAEQAPVTIDATPVPADPSEPSPALTGAEQSPSPLPDRVDAPLDVDPARPAPSLPDDDEPISPEDLI